MIKFKTFIMLLSFLLSCLIVIIYTPISNRPLEVAVTVINKNQQNKIKDIESNIINYIEDNNYDVSVIYYSINNDYLFSINGNKDYYSASIIKLLDIIYLLDNPQLINEDIMKLMELVLTISDNIAHRSLINYIGIENLKEYQKKLGITNIINNYYSNINAFEALLYLEKIYQHVNSPVISWMTNDYYNYLNYNNHLIAHKYGYYDIYYHDIGIYYGDNLYYLIILTKEGKNDYATIINEISVMIGELNIIVNKK